MRDRIQVALLALAATALCVACITLQPTDQTVVEGQSATFTVVASGAGVTTYRWQRSVDGGSTWTAIPAATRASYVTPAATLADTGTRFRAIVTDDDGVATSNAAILTVTMAPPRIAMQPSDRAVLEGESATFGVTAAGSGTISYQWQRSDDGGTTWSAVPGATLAAFTLAGATLGDDGARFACVVSNEAGSVQSQAAALAVGASYGGWWSVYADDGGLLEPLVALEFRHAGATVRYLDVALTLADGEIHGSNGGLGFDLVVVDHDSLQGTLVAGARSIDVVLVRSAPSGTHRAQGDLTLDSTTAYACVESLDSDVWFVSVDHMGCDRSVMFEIEPVVDPLMPGSYVVGEEVDVGVYVEEIVDGQYVPSSCLAVAGAIEFTAVDATRVTGTYAIVTAAGESITGSFDAPVFVTW